MDNSILIGVKKCGCAVAVITNDDSYRARHALADWQKRELEVRPSTVEEAQQIIRRCKHEV